MDLCSLLSSRSVDRGERLAQVKSQSEERERERERERETAMRKKESRRERGPRDPEASGCLGLKSLQVKLDKTHQLVVIRERSQVKRK